MPAISAALLVASAVAFSLSTAEGSAGLAAQELGYDGETIRIVAVEADDEAGTERFRQALIGFADTHHASIAYSAYAESGVVAVQDSLHRFRGRSGALAAPLAASGSKPAAVLSTRVPEAAGVRSGLLGSGVSLVGTFESEAAFDSSYPALVENMAAARPGSGVYLVAGLPDSDRSALRLLFSRSGIRIVNWDVQTPAAVGYILSTLYGGIVMAFAMLSALAALLVTQIHSVLLRRRLIVAAVAGATRRDLARLLLGRLVPLVTAGSAVGVLVDAGVFLFLRGVMQIGPATIGRAVALSLGGCVLLWMVILACVSWWETRRCWRAVSC